MERERERERKGLPLPPHLLTLHSPPLLRAHTHVPLPEVLLGKRGYGRREALRHFPGLFLVTGTQSGKIALPCPTTCLSTTWVAPTCLPTTCVAPTGVAHTGVAPTCLLTITCCCLSTGAVVTARTACRAGVPEPSQPTAATLSVGPSMLHQDREQRHRLLAAHVSAIAPIEATPCPRRL